MLKSVLIYNWAQFDNPNMDGGGVSVYIKNIIEALLEQDIRVVFLSAGFSYTGIHEQPFIEETDNMFRGSGVRSFRVVNSPVKAPAHDSYGDLYCARENEEIAELFIDFMGQYGPFDEVHFHNIEGISTVLFEKIKSKTNAKIAYWLHNYHSICPQIELFKDGLEKCDNYHEGADCIGCLHFIPSKEDRIEQRVNARKNGNDNIVVLRKPKLKSTQKSHTKAKAIYKKILKIALAPLYLCIVFIRELKKAIRRKQKQAILFVKGVHVLNLIYRQYRKARKEIRILLGIQQREEVRVPKFSQEISTPWKNRMNIKSEEVNNIDNLRIFYKEWRDINIQRLNYNVDYLYAVSEQVKEQFVARGVFSDKIKTVPLGMDIYNRPEDRVRFYLSKTRSEKIRIGYFGYSITSKGLAFLIDSIESIEDLSVLSNIDLRIHCRVDDLLMRRISRLKPFLGNVSVLDGYNRGEIFEIAQELDLVIVPSLWWETYNQVAYEMMMLGTPVIVSDSVGIKYAIPNEFIFKSGDRIDCARIISYYTEDKSRLGSFWDSSQKSHKLLPSMREHLLMVLGDRFLGTKSDIEREVGELQNNFHYLTPFAV